MDGMIILSAIGFIVIVLIIAGVKIVPQQEVWIVEKLGKFDRKLEAGLHLLVPYIERVSYQRSLKEDIIEITKQTAITKDNVTLRIDGFVYVRVVDAVSSCYGAHDPYVAVAQLAQTTMRSEIGKMTLDRTFEERESMNANIVESINEAAGSWGIQCMRYEIKDIHPPETVLQAMELQVAAERQKRAEVLESEGRRQSAINKSEGEKQSQINNAEGKKQQAILESEGNMTEQVNHAKGESESIRLVAEATANSIDTIAKSIQNNGGERAVSLRVAEQYVAAFKEIAQKGNTVIIPANANDAGSIITQAMSIYNSIDKNTKK